VCGQLRRGGRAKKPSAPARAACLRAGKSRRDDRTGERNNLTPSTAGVEPAAATREFPAARAAVQRVSGFNAGNTRWCVVHKSVTAGDGEALTLQKLWRNYAVAMALHRSVSITNQKGLGVTATAPIRLETGLTGSAAVGASATLSVTCRRNFGSRPRRKCGVVRTTQAFGQPGRGHAGSRCMRRTEAPSTGERDGCFVGKGRGSDLGIGGHRRNLSPK